MFPRSALLAFAFAASVSAFFVSPRNAHVFLSRAFESGADAQEKGVEKRLADLTLDTPFKLAFAKNNRNLQNLLNCLLFRHENVSITSIEDVTRPGTDASGVRNVIYDVFCTLSNEERLIIEMQKSNQRADIIDRLVGYQARDYATQWEKGTTKTSGYKLIPVRVLAILGFKMASVPGCKDEMIQKFKISAVRPSADFRISEPIERRFGEMSDYTIVQLPFAPDSPDKCVDDAEKWCVLLRDSGKFSVDTLPAQFAEDPFKAVVDRALYSNLSAEEIKSLQAEEDLERNISSSRLAEEEFEKELVESKEKVAKAEEKAAKAAEKAAKAEEKADDAAQKADELIRELKSQIDQLKKKK